jgi:hypothetical protein
MRATYHRRKGTEQFLGFYDVHADCLSGLFRRRKRIVERHARPSASAKSWDSSSGTPTSLVNVSRSRVGP